MILDCFPFPLHRIFKKCLEQKETKGTKVSKREGQPESSGWTGQ